VEKFLNEHLGTGRWREDEEILSWFGDWELLEPGLVPLPEWRPAARGPARKNDAALRVLKRDLGLSSFTYNFQVSRAPCSSGNVELGR